MLLRREYSWNLSYFLVQFITHLNWTLGDYTRNFNNDNRSHDYFSHDSKNTRAHLGFFNYSRTYMLMYMYTRVIFQQSPQNTGYPRYLVSLSLPRSPSCSEHSQNSLFFYPEYRFIIFANLSRCIPEMCIPATAIERKLSRVSAEEWLTFSSSRPAGGHQAERGRRGKASRSQPSTHELTEPSVSLHRARRYIACTGVVDNFAGDRDTYRSSTVRSPRGHRWLAWVRALFVLIWTPYFFIILFFLLFSNKLITSALQKLYYLLIP